MFLTIVGYIFACLAIAVVSPLMSIAFFPLMPFLRRFRAFAPIFMAFTSAVCTIASVFLFIWVAILMDIRMSYLMFLIPLILSIRNDFGRIDKARRGATPVARAAGEDYDADLQVKMEYGYLIGDIAGIAIPLLVVGHLPFM